MEYDQIKELVLFMKKQQVQQFEVDGLAVVFSPEAFFENPETPEEEEPQPTYF